VCEDRASSPTLTVFVNFQTLSTIINRPSSINSWLIARWSYQQLVDGKGPWDGLGAMVKTKVTLDITHGKEHTMTGKITSPILVAQHWRTTFCTNEWLMEHVDSRINEMVVMYQSPDQVIRPPFSFLFLGVSRHYAKRPFNSWWKGCSRV
jgi:hypothetical protein